GSHHAVVRQMPKVLAELVDVDQGHPVTPTREHQIRSKENPLRRLRPTVPISKALLPIIFVVIPKGSEPNDDVLVQLPLNRRRSVHTVSIHNQEFLWVNLCHLFGDGVPEANHPISQGHMLEITTVSLAEIPQQHFAPLCGVEGFAFGTGTKRGTTTIVRRYA